MGYSPDESSGTKHGDVLVVQIKTEKVDSFDDDDA